MSLPAPLGSGLAYAEVIGDPIAHSKSPAIHKFWLRKLGIAGEYRPCHLRAEQLAGYFAERRADPLWRGCNITIPHKLAALRFADRADNLAQAIGATNCVSPNGAGGLDATNTDADGFGEPLAAIDFAGREAVVVGAGGAARAVLAWLRSRGIGFVTLLNRTRDNAAALLDEFALTGTAGGLDRALPAGCALLVNSSRLGMEGNPSLILDLAPLPAEAVVYDIVYAPLETPLLAAARARGLRTIDGLAMLIGQAAVAFEVFFLRPPPREHDAELRAMLTS